MNTMNVALNKASELHCAISTHKCHTEYALGALLYCTLLVNHAARSPSTVHPLVGTPLGFCIGWT